MRQHVDISIRRTQGFDVLMLLPPSIYSFKLLLCFSLCFCLRLMLMPAFIVRTELKGEGHSRKLTFSFSTHRSARYPEEILLERVVLYSDKFMHSIALYYIHITMD